MTPTELEQQYWLCVRDREVLELKQAAELQEVRDKYESGLDHLQMSENQTWVRWQQALRTQEVDLFISSGDQS